MSSINYGFRARLGVIFPSGNTAIEPQFEALRPQGVSCHYSRLTLNGSSDEELLLMARDVEGAATLVKHARVGLVAFHCTAVSTWKPELEADILQRVESTTGLRAIATSQALVSALRAVGAHRIVMLSPYLRVIAEREQVFMERNGFEVLVNEYLGVSTPEEMIGVTPETWLKMLLENANDKADAYLVSCTAIRAADVIQAAEALLGKPVISSNTSMLWHACRQLGIADAMPGLGRLGTLA